MCWLMVTEHSAELLGMEELVNYAAASGYGVLPTPYIREAVIHNGIDSTLQYGAALIEAVIRLHHMDAAEFRRSRELSFTPIALDRLEAAQWIARFFTGCRYRDGTIAQPRNLTEIALLPVLSNGTRVN